MDIKAFMDIKSLEVCKCKRHRKTSLEGYLRMFTFYQISLVSIFWQEVNIIMVSIMEASHQSVNILFFLFCCLNCVYCMNIFLFLDHF